MDLQSTVTAFPRATSIDGLDRAWTWPLNTVLNFAGALTGDCTRLLQMNQIRRHDEALPRAEDGAVYTGMDSVSLWAAAPDEALEKLTRPVRLEALDPTSIWSPNSTRAT
ncbi:hypothetical protein ABT215_18610 [Streptomyces sp900105755]|uniref:hypothetical protein n=1 Tax=Streptomyces sp. 900105755 TaxID=3154389 RepID=UPI00332532E8